MIIKNLSQLKKALIPGAEFVIVKHFRKDNIGQRRAVNIARSTGIYSIVADDPTNRETLANCGKGTWLGWDTAGCWSFDGEMVSRYKLGELHTDENLLVRFKVLPPDDESGNDHAFVNRDL